MGVKEEIQAYESVHIIAETGEVELWDNILFPRVIRKRQVAMLLNRLSRMKPARILDLGCGAGWLTKMLTDNGYNSFGLDVSAYQITSAVKTCKEGRFVVGDSMNLPFADESFDCIMCSAILHHIDARQALLECRRVIRPGGTIIVMEPNKLNYIAALGRKLTNLQTEDEEPFSPGMLKKLLGETGWTRSDVTSLFPFSFSLSYAIKVMRLGNAGVMKLFCPPIEFIEILLEKIPGLNQMNYLICGFASTDSLGMKSK